MGAAPSVPIVTINVGRENPRVVALGLANAASSVATLVATASLSDCPAPTTSRMVPIQQLVEAGDKAMQEALSTPHASALGVDVSAEHWVVAEGLPLRSDDPGCEKDRMRRRSSAVAAGAWHAVFAPGTAFGVDTDGFTHAITVLVVFALTVAPTKLFSGSTPAAARELPSIPAPTQTTMPTG